jgi:hypothetical protein
MIIINDDVHRFGRDGVAGDEDIRVWFNRQQAAEVADHHGAHRAIIFEIYGGACPFPCGPYRRHLLGIRPSQIKHPQQQQA